MKNKLEFLINYKMTFLEWLFDEPEGLIDKDEEFTIMMAFSDYVEICHAIGKRGVAKATITEDEYIIIMQTLLKGFETRKHRPYIEAFEKVINNHTQIKSKENTSFFKKFFTFFKKTDIT